MASLIPVSHTPADVARSFGSALRARRRERGFSQAGLAAAMRSLGHSWGQSTVAKSEAATRPVTVGEAQALADALSTTVGALYGEDPCADPNTGADLIADLVWTRARLARAEAEAATARAAHAAARGAYTAAHLGLPTSTVARNGTRNEGP